MVEQLPSSALFKPGSGYFPKNKPGDSFRASPYNLDLVFFTKIKLYLKHLSYHVNCEKEQG